MQKRDESKPFGMRSSLDVRREENRCENWGDDSINDVSLQGYQNCVLRFRERDFLLSPNNNIDLYCNYPTEMLSWIETCRTDTEARACVWEPLNAGLNYIMGYDDRFVVSFLFENMTPEEQIFQLEYTDAFRQVSLSEDLASTLIAGFSLLMML